MIKNLVKLVIFLAVMWLVLGWLYPGQTATMVLQSPAFKSTNAETTEITGVEFDDWFLQSPVRQGRVKVRIGVPSTSGPRGMEFREGSISITTVGRFWPARVDHGSLSVLNP